MVLGLFGYYPWHYGVLDFLDLVLDFNDTWDIWLLSLPLKVNYVYPDPLLHERWYVGTKGSQSRRVQKS